ncbi:MAG TPA: tRNA pseudouridine(38-40) synthase TruA [Chitinophagales bacterium]|nr:tRNA pseudouridine(38-40) synthase TruA [Chitinophagales bacterium]HRK25945.1 tRNA pseudouridine(38-40) synthase TruA [Chitinophagales bacterium]
MARFKITLEYEGTRYAGWQLQHGLRTIQGEIVGACRELFHTDELEIYGAGRTDAGVHALGQVAHLEVKTALNPMQIRIGLNDQLPPDINLLTVEKAPPDFHARHSAIARSYVYHIATRRSAFGKKLVWWVKDRLNLNAMDYAAQAMEGLRDFQSFTDASPNEQSTLVEVHFVHLYPTPNAILVHIVGSHFLWKMVRRMVGILVEAGRENFSAAEVERLFTRPSRTPAQFTAPPSGLYLERVYYPGQTIQEGVTPLLHLQ